MALKNTYIAVFLSLFVSCASQRHAQRGWNLLEKGMAKESIVEFKKSMELNDKLPGSYCGLIESYGILQDFKKAEEYIKLGLEKNPNQWQLNLYIGKYYLYYANKYKMAIEYYEKVTPYYNSESIQRSIKIAKEKLKEEQAKFQ